MRLVPHAIKWFTGEGEADDDGEKNLMESISEMESSSSSSEIDEVRDAETGEVPKPKTTPTSLPRRVRASALNMGLYWKMKVCSHECSRDTSSCTLNPIPSPETLNASHSHRKAGNELGTRAPGRPLSDSVSSDRCGFASVSSALTS